MSFNLPNVSAKDIDLKKRKIEIANIPRIKSIFNNLANGVAALYAVSGNIATKELANNYTSEFITEIRKIYRRTIKEFGFTIRKTSETKYDINFDTKQWIDKLEYKEVVKVADEELEDKIENINQQFLQDATFFIANQPEKKTEYITETNEKIINEALLAGLLIYNNTTQELEENILNSTIDKQQQATQKLQKHIKNKNKFVAKKIKEKIKEKSQSRSELIVEDAVGVSEAWSRNKEAELIHNAKITISQTTTLSVQKQWSAILDDVTREAHVIADKQVVDVEELFLVGGEFMKYPRDPNASIGNIARCRCVAEYKEYKI